MSLTGTLQSPEATTLIEITLDVAGTVSLQTYGFGGGTNHAGLKIPAGGFDPFIGIFSGDDDSAVFINGTSDDLTNYSPGCPPAGTVAVGGDGGQCGDVAMTFTGLAAGSYTVLVSDAAYIPNAVFEDPGGTLGDGFADLTGGAFQTCVDASNCNIDTGNWAIDITSPSTAAGTPEPASGLLAACCLTALPLYRKYRKGDSKQ
jgi:hypothetical protein